MTGVAAARGFTGAGVAALVTVSTTVTALGAWAGGASVAFPLSANPPMTPAAAPASSTAAIPPTFVLFMFLIRSQ